MPQTHSCPNLLFSVLLLAALFSTSAHAANSYTWTGTDGDWSTPANWSPQGVPGAADDAIVHAGTVTVGTVSVNLLTIHAGTVSVNTSLTAASIGCSGTLTGPGVITATTTFGLLGTLNGTGPTFIQAGANAIANFATLSQRTLTNAGTLEIGRNVKMEAGAVLNNSGTIFGRGDADIEFSAGAATINNSGIFRGVSGGNGNGFLLSNSLGAGTFNNTGTVDAQSALSIHVGGADTASTYTIGAFATLSLEGTRTLNPGCTFGSADGNVTLNGGTLTFNVPYAATGTLSITGGTTVFNANVPSTLIGIALSTGGTAVVNATVPVKDLYLNDSAVSGSGTLTVAQTATWFSGTMSGTGTTSILPGATITLYTSGPNRSCMLSQRTLSNAGTMAFSGVGSSLFMNTGAVINNSGMLDVATSTTCISFETGGGTINNSGTFKKTGGTNSALQNTTGSGTFNNTGALSVQSGTLTIAGPYTQTAGSTALAGGDLSGSSFSIQGGTLAGTGTITGNVINSGGTTIPGGPDAGLLTISGNYTQSGTGALSIQLGGAAGGTQVDKLAVSGSATLGGTLEVSLINNFTPADGSTFDVLTYGSQTGTFSFTSPVFGAGKTLNANYGATALSLSSRTPLPPTAPTITSTLSATGSVGTSFTYTITATGSAPVAFTAAPLPAGLALNGANISGTPTAAGPTNVLLTATNGTSPNDQKTLVLTILGAPGTNHPPEFTSLPTASTAPFMTGNILLFTCGVTDPDGDPITVMWDFGDSTTGVGANLTHVYPVAGTYQVKVTASDDKNPVASIQLTFSVTVEERKGAPKPAKLNIITIAVQGGGFQTIVACTAGQVVLTANDPSLKQVSISDGKITLLTVNTPVAGVTSTTPVIIQAGNVERDALKALKANAVQDILVTVGKGGSVAFTALVINADASKTTGKFTTLAGVVTKNAWKTAGAEKFSLSWSESAAKISVKQLFKDVSFTAEFKGPTGGSLTAAKASLKVGKVTYAGTAMHNPATGKITFTGSPKKPTGTTATFAFDPADPAGQTMIVTTNGVVGTPVTHTTPKAAPDATAPDGRAANQNMRRRLLTP